MRVHIRIDNAANKTLTLSFALRFNVIIVASGKNKELASSFTMNNL